MPASECTKAGELPLHSSEQPWHGVPARDVGEKLAQIGDGVIEERAVAVAALEVH